MDGRGQPGRFWVYEDIFTTDFPGEPFQSWKKNIKWNDWQIPIGRGKGNICLCNLYLLAVLFVLPAPLSFTGEFLVNFFLWQIFFLHEIPKCSCWLCDAEKDILTWLLDRFSSQRSHQPSLQPRDTTDHTWRGNLLLLNLLVVFIHGTNINLSQAMKIKIKCYDSSSFSLSL